MTVEELAKRSASFEEGHRELVGRGIVDGVLPLKFAYAGSAATTHDELARTETYKSVTGAVAHVAAALRKAGMGGARRIAEIGPGNGLTTIALLQNLKANQAPIEEFLGLDFSETLLQTAAGNFTHGMPGVTFGSVPWDVESAPTGAIREFRRGEPLPVLFLGNTIGNLENPAAAVRHILASLSPGDVLLVGATLRAQGPGEADQMLAPYENEVFYAAALEPLLAFGIDRSWLDFRLSYLEDERHEVVGVATLTRPVTVLDTTLPAGHRIRCFRSQRYAFGEVEGLFKEAPGITVQSAVDASADHLVVTATKG